MVQLLLRLKNPLLRTRLKPRLVLLVLVVLPMLLLLLLPLLLRPPQR